VEGVEGVGCEGLEGAGCEGVGQDVQEESADVPRWCFAYPRRSHEYLTHTYTHACVCVLCTMYAVPCVSR